MRGNARRRTTRFVEAKEQLDALIKTEVAERGRAPADAGGRPRRDELDAPEEHRRLAEERRDELVRAEQRVLTELSGRLISAQKEIEAKLTAWQQDVERTREGLATQVARLEQRQKQMFTDAESRFTAETERLVAETEDHRAALARLREEMAKQIKEVIDEGTTELEMHAAERRRALHEVADRLRHRERTLAEQIDRELGEAMGKLTETFADVERRMVEQVQRSVAREAGRLSEEAAVEFSSTIRGAREEAGRRLQRELDRAIETFSRQAEKLLAERLVEFGDTAGGKLERRYEGTIASLERRVTELESQLREREKALTND